MTAQEMLREAEIVFDAIPGDDAPGIMPREWSFLLTKAQEEILLEIIEEGADRNDQNRQILRPVTEKFKESSLTLSNYEIEVPNFPEDVLHVAAERALVNSRRIPISPKEHTYVDININNPFERPYEELWWRYVKNNTHVIRGHEESTTFDYELIYYRRPSPIIVEGLEEGDDIEGVTEQTDCELNNAIHRRISHRAAYIAMAASGYERGMQGYIHRVQTPTRNITTRGTQGPERPE